jgi:CHAD domain-containing protein
MTPHPDLLDLPASEGARAVVLGLLAEARERAGRLANPGDDEALHDFRVSVRRLRSALRTWREVLGRAVRDKDVRRLRRVARSTGEARDTEVLLAWVDQAARELPASQRPVAGWLARRLAPPDGEARLRRAARRLVEAADGLFHRLGRELIAGRTVPTGPTYGSAVAARIREQARAVGGFLARVETLDDAPIAHRARIRGKRLRYLLEPLRDAPGAPAARALKSMKRLQDLLGELNDARVASEVLRAVRREDEEDPAAGPGIRRGLVTLDALAARRAEAAFERLRTEVLTGHGDAALGPALDVAAALEARGYPGR